MRLDPNNEVSWAFTFGASLERAVSVVPHGSSSYLVAYEDKVLELPASGTGATSISFGLPASAKTREVASVPSGDWAVAAELERTFPEQDALVVRVASSGSVVWQQLLANGGRTLVSSLTPLADGGLIMTGSTRPAGPTVPMDGLVVAFAADGSVVWQRTYGTGGAIRLESAVETPNGIVVGGTSSGAFTALEVAKGDGAVISATRYGLTTSLPMGMVRSASGELLFAGITTTAHTYQFLKTAPDLQVACGDGSSISTSIQVPSAPGSLNVTTSTFTPTPSAVTTTPVTVTPGAPQAVTPVEKCGGG
jgi:hypothetical protein